MNIKADIETLLAETGWNVAELVRKTGANKDSIYMLLRGDRKDISTKTLSRLWPYLYGDKRPEAMW